MMKLSRLMLAAVAVCGTSAVMAQSSVTIYGRVNTTIEHQKTGTLANKLVKNLKSYRKLLKKKVQIVMIMN